MLDADVMGSFHPMVLHPPSHGILNELRGVKVVSPRDGRDVVRGRIEADSRSKPSSGGNRDNLRPRRVRAR